VAYATQADMVDEFGELELAQLTDRISASAIDAEVLKQALDSATEEIDSYLAARYTVPLEMIPAALVPKCADIARYRLYKDAPPDVVIERYKMAIRWLENVAKGLIALPVTPAPVSHDTPDFDDQDRIFTKTTLEGF
jgi:phage gp36-like protein